MARWNFRNVPEELDREMREVAKANGVSLKGAVMMRLNGGGGKLPHKSHTNATQMPHKGEEEREAAPDPRHGVVRELIRELYRKKFQVECTWDGSEGKELARLLKANPKWTEGQLKTMVENYFKTEGVTAERPRVWIKTLGAYVAGALNRYRRVAEKGNGEGKKTSGDQYLSREEIEAKNEKRYREMVERGEIIEREV